MQRRTKQENTLYELLDSFERINTTAGAVIYKKDDYIQIIKHYLSRRNLDQAQKAVEEALHHYPFIADFFALKSQIARKSGNLEESLEMIEEAICIAPLETSLTFEKSLILSDLGEFDEAIITLRQIRPYLNKKERFPYNMCLAQIYEAQHEFELMFSALVDALRYNPDSTEALEMIWSCVEMGKLYERSIRFHKGFIDLYPYAYMAWFNLGHAYSCEGLYERAIDALEYSFLINGDFEAGYLDCAELCQQVGMHQKAVDIYLDAYNNFGPDADLNVLIAENLLKVGQYDKAKKYLLEAIYFDSYNDEAYFQLGQCYLAKRNWVAAEHAFDKAISIEDQREDYYCGIAEAYIQLNRIEDAEENLQTAIELGPDNARYWILLSQLLVDQRRYEETIDLLEEAEENSESTEFQYFRAAALFGLQRKREALIVLETALREGFADHEKLFIISPALRHDQDVLSIIHYFEGEPTNASI